MKKYLPNEDYLVMSRQQVRNFDSWAIKTVGISGLVLMENAGRSCAELIKKKYRDSLTKNVTIFCGTGNNGGDGYVIARHLLNESFDVKVVICGDLDKVKGDALVNLEILGRMGRRQQELKIEKGKIASKVRGFGYDCDVIVDCIFGTGLSGQLSDGYIELIEAINGLSRPIVAVDIPSGLDCDTGRPLEAAIKASYTVTFAAVKKGFEKQTTAAEYTGQIFVASIGIEPTDYPGE